MPTAPRPPDAAASGVPAQAPASGGEHATSAGDRAAKPTGSPASVAESTEALARAQAASETTVPPALTGKALAEELKRNAKERVSDRAAVQAERLRLEAVVKEIADARAALREETAKLESVAGRSGKLPGGAQGTNALDQLARTVKGMKPAEAAAVLARVDRPLAAAILEKMRPADAAQVIGKMEPSMGAALFGLLARADAGRKP